MCAWIHERLSPVLYTPQNSVTSSVEILFIELLTGRSKLLCCTLYVPPGLSKHEHDIITSYLSEEFDSLLAVRPDERIILAGDLNDFKTAFLNEQFNLINKVITPTRCDAILDQIWVNECLNDQYLKAAAVGPPIGNSDHNTVLLRSLYQERADDADYLSFVPVWDFRESFLSAYLDRLSKTDFSSLSYGSTVDDMCDDFYELLRHCTSVIPCKYVRFSRNDKPWVSPVLKLLINERWAAFRRHDWQKYQHLKAKVKSEIERSKKLWGERQASTAKGLWNIVNETRGARAKESLSSLMSKFQHVGKFLEALTNEFIGNFNFDSDEQPVSLENQSWNISLSPEAVYNKLRCINLKKATGPDLIPARLLRVGAVFLCKPLCEIFNRSLITKSFPEIFKMALISPIPKKPSPSLADLRPISILCIIGKVFEQLVLDYMKYDLCRCYGAEQHAYRPLGSTTSALVEINHHIAHFLDMKSTLAVRVLCLDLSKAFDRLQFHRLINHLCQVGLNQSFLQWLKSYLSGRRFRVKIKSQYGPAVDIPSGVPQGSVLGPHLFAAFMGAIKFNANNVRCIKYADDVTLVEAIVQPTQDLISLPHVRSVFLSVGLMLNESKSKELFIHRSRNTVTQNSDFQRVESVKILGMTLSCDVKWNLHIKDVLKRASRRLYVIRCLRNVLSPRDLVRVYHAIITALFLYASPALGRLPLSLINKLESFQRRAHRLICGRHCDCNLFPALTDRFLSAGLKLLKASEESKHHPLNPLVPHRLQRSQHLSVPFASTGRFSNSFFPWISIELNKTIGEH